MSGSELAGRYAKALFELAAKNKSEGKVEADLLGLMKAIDELPLLQSALDNPVISKHDLSSAITDILKKLQATNLTLNFTKVLVQNGRIKYITAIATKYYDLMMESRGEKQAYVTTATKLLDSQVEEVEKALGKALGSKIKAVTAVNDEILGGIIVRIGSQMLDASIAGQLDKLAMLNKKAIANLN